MNVFGRIARGEIPCHRVWEDERHLAFLDHRPIAPGHTLVIPKREVAYLFDLDAEAYAELWLAVRTVAELLRAALSCRRVCVVVAGYDVPHVHVHLIPTNDARDFPPPPAGTATDAELAAMAARLVA